jgi:hypothetical protein
MGTAKGMQRAAPRLYLVTPPVGDPDAVADDLADALNVTDIAASRVATKLPCWRASRRCAS